MRATIPLDGPVDVDALAAVFHAGAGDGRMSLSELDGYLAGVIVGPDLLMPHSWLPQIWGENGMPSETMEEAGSVLGLIMRRYNEIIRQIDEGPKVYRPILGTGDAYAESVMAWGIGFVTAFGLDPDAWLPAIKSNRGMPFVMPMLALAAEMPMSIDASEFQLPEEELQMLIDGAEMLLPICVCGLREFWQQRAARRTGSRTTAKKTRRARH